MSEEKTVKTKKAPVKRTPKKVDNTEVKEAKENTSDLQVFGDGDTFQLICKASSKAEGWMKSTKAMEVPGSGCVVQVTTQVTNPDGSYSVAEALTFVPNATIRSLGGDPKNGRKLMASDKR